MFEIKQKAKMTERALLIAAFTESANEAHAQSLLEELEELVSTLGIPVVDRKLVFHRIRERGRSFFLAFRLTESVLRHGETDRPQVRLITRVRPKGVPFSLGYDVTCRRVRRRFRNC